MLYPADVKFGLRRYKDRLERRRAVLAKAKDSLRTTRTVEAPNVCSQSAFEDAGPRCNSRKHLCHHNDLLPGHLFSSCCMHAHFTGRVRVGRQSKGGPLAEASRVVAKTMMIAKGRRRLSTSALHPFPLPRRAHRHDSGRPRRGQIWKPATPKCLAPSHLCSFGIGDAGSFPLAKVGQVRFEH